MMNNVLIYTHACTLYMHLNARIIFYNQSQNLGGPSQCLLFTLHVPLLVLKAGYLTLVALPFAYWLEQALEWDSYSLVMGLVARVKD